MLYKLIENLNFIINGMTNILFINYNLYFYTEHYKSFMFYYTDSKLIIYCKKRVYFLINIHYLKVLEESEKIGLKTNNGFFTKSKKTNFKETVILLLVLFRKLEAIIDFW